MMPPERGDSCAYKIEHPGWPEMSSMQDFGPKILCTPYGLAVYLPNGRKASRGGVDGKGGVSVTVSAQCPINSAASPAVLQIRAAGVARAYDLTT